MLKGTIVRRGEAAFGTLWRVECVIMVLKGRDRSMRSFLTFTIPLLNRPAVREWCRCGVSSRKGRLPLEFGELSAHFEVLLLDKVFRIAVVLLFPIAKKVLLP